MRKRKCRVCGKVKRPAYKGSARCGPCRTAARRANKAAWERGRAQSNRYARAWRAANPNAARKANREYAARIRRHHPQKALLWQARGRAATKGIVFKLTLDDIPAIPKFCPVLGVRMRRSNGTRAPNSPSLDRIIPSLGYVPGNIAVISHRANQIKNNGTSEEHLKVYRWLKKHEAYIAARPWMKVA